MNQAEVSRMKAAVRNRDGHKCTRCGMTADESRAKWRRTLEVHRLQPGGEYSLAGCVTLCRTCHGPEPKSKHGSGHRKGDTRFIDVGLELRDALAVVAEDHCTSMSNIAKRACIEYLEKHGEWPPPKPAG